VPVHRHDEVAPPEQFAELHAPVRSAAGLAVGVDDLHATVRGAPRDLAPERAIADEAEELPGKRLGALLKQIDRDLGILDGCHGMVIGAT
jgi:hypothetical protein